MTNILVRSEWHGNASYAVHEDPPPDWRKRFYPGREVEAVDVTQEEVGDGILAKAMTVIAVSGDTLDLLAAVTLVRAKDNGAGHAEEAADTAPPTVEGLLKLVAAQQAESEKLLALIGAKSAEISRLKTAYRLTNDEVCQTLGKALGYPWFKDDQKNFPGATADDGVCVGDHIAESIAAEAASHLDLMTKVKAELDEERVTAYVRGLSWCWADDTQRTLVNGNIRTYAARLRAMLS